MSNPFVSPVDQQNDLSEIVTEILDAIYASSSSSSEDSESENEQHGKSYNFEVTLDEMGDMDFKAHMRLQRETVVYLTTRYSTSSFGVDQAGGGRSRITPKKSVYMYIWYISNTVTFRQLGNLFGVAKSSAWSVVKRVSCFLISISDEYIKWPEGVHLQKNSEKFYRKQRIPGVIGAIGCTHIAIKAPKGQQEMYLDRKKTYSIVLQAVVDADKKFIDVTCGEPGSLHDHRVLRRSKLFDDADRLYEEMFAGSYFLIGDSAYPTTKWLVPSYKDYGNLTQGQLKFNEIHSSTRMVVQYTFGLLKGRFRRLLKFTELTDLEMITNIVVSACVLHNICITQNDFCDVGEENEMDDSAPFVLEEEIKESNSNANLNRRQNLFNYLRQHNLI
ncbi:putative nuclease HARBI1 isoform X2 [Eurosta solidaginis]|uniref:putative nuclease HARBI1 isoform X2 n=1 Tax=Eurosta solidaginis TaxID=178769 RepID=UPI00353127A9